jgi:hypothetical protein
MYLFYINVIYFSVFNPNYNYFSISYQCNTQSHFITDWSTQKKAYSAKRNSFQFQERTLLFEQNITLFFFKVLTSE